MLGCENCSALYFWSTFLFCIGMATHAAKHYKDNSLDPKDLHIGTDNTNQVSWDSAAKPLSADRLSQGVSGSDDRVGPSLSRYLDEDTISFPASTSVCRMPQRCWFRICLAIDTARSTTIREPFGGIYEHTSPEHFEQARWYCRVVKVGVTKPHLRNT